MTMSIRWIAFLVVSAALPCLAFAQSLPVPDAAIRQLPVYQIDLMIVEGLEASADREWIAPESLLVPNPKTSAFADPAEGEADLARSSPPETIAEALESEQAADAVKSLPPRDSVSIESDSMGPGRLPPPEWVALRKRIQANPDLRILSQPMLLVLDEHEAAVHVASQQVFEYLVPIGDGKFEVRKTEPQELGIRLTFVVNPADDPEAVVLSPVQIEVTSLDGREPVNGLGLDVGKPIISTRSIETSVPLRFGEERTVPIPSGPTQAAAVILRVERVEFERLMTPTTANER
jgi:hypothetical protein